MSDRKKILEVRGVNAYYEKQVLYDINFTIYENEILGLVGESGCGKTTLSKAILGLGEHTQGEIIHHTSRPQMIFQDPYASLNPVKKIGWILEEPLKLKGGIPKTQRREAVMDILKKVGLDEKIASRLPRELSGGQRQRVSIAAALINGSRFIIADEPVSALDVTVQAQIMELLLKLADEFQLSYLFISHDLNVIYQMCDRLIVMKEGRIVEEGSIAQVFNKPQNPYTKQLLELEN
ncbi:ABC transporter ATP-binding protein [Diplocloster agilis]|uniref:ABC transporter ATP-binding protein n=1 Tax=Diplocloster agilis TaxID=2850323 RepID=UPI0008229352|nr:ATP-binding cassette domain-containing protein [Suonthocola fibrivorans]MCU6736276.1 ATP-binding cassette domain-containing protein [Suonthocola fibrivorans]SCJ88616.1 Glutathione import ATP-binding protein GsiA [uncultured Clostridium sp.]